ncbi:IS3 family transposase [Pseudonocardia sp. N23]|uniref:IS3 family transposase n=1 Tax=Pseudonocardia sp. N23 TaxID=1987376 RepID=UPI000BFB3A28|nr:IS3 family transposase [Pseudonocardia sp. N23]GAY08498.1 mobile element protein [Pseudonocardia sp. N23]
MENFFSALKTELVYRTSWRTREQAENALFAYIDGWYNTERIQAGLGWRSPDEYEATWRTQTSVLDDQPATPIDGADPAPAR